MGKVVKFPRKTKRFDVTMVITVLGMEAGTPDEAFMAVTDNIKFDDVLLDVTSVKVTPAQEWEA